MTCSIKNKLKNNFQIEFNENTEIPSDKTVAVSQWINMYKSIMEQSNFNEEVFKIKINKGSNGIIVNFNEENAKKWEVHEDYIKAQDAFNELENREFKNSGLIVPEQSVYEDDGEQGFFDYEEEESVVDNPVNLTELKNNLINMQKSIEKQNKSYSKHTNDKRKLEQGNKALLKIEKLIAKFSTDDVEVAHETLMEEMAFLKILLLNIKDNPENAFLMLETNKVKERINDLSVYFTGMKILDSSETKEDETQKQLLYNTFGESKIKDIQYEINQLKTLYKTNLSGIVKSVFENDTLVVEHKRKLEKINPNETAEEKVKREEKLAEFQEFVKKAKEQIDSKISKLGDEQASTPNFVGAASVDSILSDLLYSAVQNFYNQEVGLTHKKLLGFSKAWEKIKDISREINGKKVFITTLLYRKDAFGIPIAKLIMPYEKVYFKFIKINNSFKSAFFKNQNPDTYESWMNNLANHVDFIQPYKLKSYFDKYKNHPKFKEFFKFSSVEMEAYEKEMRTKMGNALFEIELEKQQESIANYVTEDANKLFALRTHAFAKNPFAFVNNFYSDNYSQADKSTFQFLEPAYTPFIPKLDKTTVHNPKNYYNSELKNLESEENGTDLLEAYKYAHQLVSGYINPSINAEDDANLGSLDLMNIQDMTDRETMKELSTFKKFTRNFTDVFNSVLREPYLVAEDTENREGLKTLYSSFGNNRQEVFRIILMAKSENDIKNLLINEGINPNIIIEDKSPTKKMLVDALIQIEINKFSSTNLFNSVVKSAELVRNMNARKNALNIWELFKEHSINKNPNKTLELEYLEDWGRINLEKQKYTLKNSDVKSLKISGAKHYLGIDKVIMEYYKNEKDNIKAEYNFKLGGDSYYKEKDKFFVTLENGEKIPLEKDDIEKKYNEYVDLLIEKLGLGATVYSRFAGIRTSLTGASMKTFSAVRYAANRLAGANQNITTAALGKNYAFDLNQLNITKRFMSGYTLKRILHQAQVRKILGKEETKKQKTIESLTMFARYFQILNNSTDELLEKGEFNSNGVLTYVGTGLLNMSTNYPEFKNQMESMISIMQNIMIDTLNVDANGNVIKEPMFDGNNTIYIPGTLQLKERFRTKENIANWEDFRADENGNSPQNLSIALMKQVNKLNQGNLDPNDKVPILGSENGKIISSFTKYLYENSRKQYGRKDADLTTGTANQLGHKIELLKHTPTLFIHLVFANSNKIFGFLGSIGAIITGTFVAPALVPFAVGAGLSIASATLFLKFNSHNLRQYAFQNKFTSEEMQLSYNYVKEILLRSINTIPNYAGKNIVDQDYINNIRYVPDGMTAKQRDLLSMSAAELGIKLGNFYAYAITATLLAAATILMSEGDDEDEKELKLIALDKILNTITNLKNGSDADFTKYTNPLAFTDASSNIIMLQMMDKKQAKFFKAFKDYGVHAISGPELALEVAKSIGAFVGLPNAATEVVEPLEYVYDARVYEEKSMFENYVHNKMLPPEKNYERMSKIIKDPIRNNLKNQIETYNNKHHIEMNSTEISSEAEKVMRSKGYYKHNGESNKSLYNKIKNKTELIKYQK